MKGEDSFIPWFPWKTNPMWTAVTSREEFGGDLSLLSMSAQDGVRLRPEGEGRAASEDLSGYRVVREGDLVVNRLSARDGAFGVAPIEGLVSPAYWVLRSNSGMDSRWLDYVLRSRPYVAELGRISKYMPPAQFDLPWDQFRRLRVPVPPLSTQTAIADFLDAKTEKIDALIEKKQRMIELLNQQFTSDLDLMMRHSTELPLRRLVTTITSGPRGWSELSGKGEKLFIRSANLQRNSIELRLEEIEFVEPPEGSESDRSQIAEGDVLVGITGANTGWVGYSDDRVVGGYISQHVALLRCRSGLGHWVAYAILSPFAQSQLQGGQYGGTKQQLGLEDLKDLKICFPDDSTREARLRSLLHRERKRNLLIDTVTSQLELLRELRTSTITAAVNGELKFEGVAS